MFLAFYQDSCSFRLAASSSVPEGLSKFCPGSSTAPVTEYSPFAASDKEGRITVTNTQGTTRIEVDKKWVGADGGTDWPENVTVSIQLTADGEEVAGKTAVLSADHPSHKFENLPMYRADGVTGIVYSVKEVEVPGGYTSEISDAEAGHITVTNKQLPVYFKQ